MNPLKDCRFCVYSNEANLLNGKTKCLNEKSPFFKKVIAYPHACDLFFDQEHSCGVEWMDLEFCCLEKGHEGHHKTLSGQLFG